MNSWRRPPDRRNSKCKGHGAEMGFAGSRNSKQHSVAVDSGVPVGMGDYFQEFIPRNHISCESGSLVTC